MDRLTLTDGGVKLPVVNISNQTVKKILLCISKAVSASDAGGNAITKYKVKDASGVNSFYVSGGAVDATGVNGYEFAASALSTLSIKGDNLVQNPDITDSNL